MEIKKIKIIVDGKTVDAVVTNDFHYLGGKKVVYDLPNGTKVMTSSKLVKLFENEKNN